MTNKLALKLFFLFVFCYLLTLMFHVPMFADDYCNSFNVGSVLEIFKLSYHEWLTWTGRIVSSVVLYSFFWQRFSGMFVVNVLTASLFCGLIYVIFLLAKGRHPSKNIDLFSLIFILALVWFTTQTFAEVVFWRTGAIVYLWVLTPTLFFIYPYLQLLDFKISVKDKVVTRLLFFIAALLLGNCLENLSISVLAFLIFVGLSLRKRQIPVPQWVWWGVIGYLIGMIILFVAPGNYVRAHDFLNQHHLVHDQSLFAKWWPFSLNMLKHLKIFLKLSVIMLLLNFGFDFKKMLTAKKYWLFMGLGLLSAYAMMGAPSINFDGRTTFPSSVFMMIALVSLLPEDYQKVRFISKPLVQIVAFGVILYLLHDMWNTYLIYENIYAQEKYRQSIIHEDIKNGITHIVVPPFYIPNKFNTYENNNVNQKRLYVTDITSDPDDWHNVCVKNYYQIDSIVLSPLK